MEVETNGRTDTTDCIIFPAKTRSAISTVTATTKTVSFTVFVSYF